MLLLFLQVTLGLLMAGRTGYLLLKRKLVDKGLKGKRENMLCYLFLQSFVLGLTCTQPIQLLRLCLKEKNARVNVAGGLKFMEK